MHFPVENRKESKDCLEGKSKVAENFISKIRARNYKRLLITSKKKPQKVFALSVQCLMTGALYRTVPPNNLYACFAVSIRKWLIN